MITSFTDRRPGISAALILLFLFLVPGCALALDDFVFLGALHAAAVFFWFTLIVQLVMFLKVERPVLIAEPFIVGLVGLCAGEVLYAVSESSALPGAGPGAGAYLFSSYLIAVCGGNASAAVGALMLYFLCLAGRKIFEAIKNR